MKPFSYSSVILCFVLCLWLTGCFKRDGELLIPEEDNFGEFDEFTKTLNGTVVLPDGALLNSADLIVVSVLDNESLDASNAFKLTILEGEVPQFLFLANNQNEVFGLGYVSPSDDFLVINAESSALGLMMLSVLSLDLTPIARQEAVMVIKSHPEFSALANEVEKLIVAGESLLSPSNVLLQSKMEQFFALAFPKSGDIDPELLTATPERLRFENRGYAHAYVAGIYDTDENLLERFTIEGASLKNGSVADFLENEFVQLLAAPVEEFELSLDGMYDVKMRSGLSFDGSEEADQALIENGLTLARLWLNLMIEPVDGYVNNECIQNILLSLQPEIEQFLKSGNPQNERQLGQLILSFIYTYQDVLLGELSDCVPQEYQGLIRLDRLANITGEVFRFLASKQSELYQVKLLQDWFNYKYTIDTCLMRAGTDIYSCINLSESSWEVFEATATGGIDGLGYEGSCDLLVGCPNAITEQCDDGSEQFYIGFTERLLIFQLDFKPSGTGTIFLEYLIQNEQTLDPSACLLSTPETYTETDLVNITWSLSGDLLTIVFVDDPGAEPIVAEIESPNQLKIEMDHSVEGENLLYRFRAL